MNAKSFTTTITIENTPIDVFNAINNVAAWWQGEVTGNSTKVNDEFEYRMKQFHYSKQKVTELIPGIKVTWLVTDSNLTFTSKPNEWTGTHIIFNISEVNGKAQLMFTHEGLIPAFECYGGCSNGWEKLIQGSLYSLITTGKGKEVF